MKKKWTCYICGTTFALKRDLVDDLKGHFEEATQEADEAVALLEELGVKAYE